MKISDGKSVTFPAPVGGVLKDQWYAVNGFVGPAFVDTVEGEDAAFDISANCEYSIVQASSAFVLGDAVYFNPTTRAFARVSAEDLVQLGYVTRASDANGVFWFARSTNVPVTV